jgi:two-component system LytT family sensor kinase
MPAIEGRPATRTTWSFDALQAILRIANKAGARLPSRLGSRVMRATDHDAHSSASREEDHPLTRNIRGYPKLFWSETKWGFGRRAALIILVWSAYGLLQTAPDLFREFSWNSFAGQMIGAWCWAILTPIILLVDHRFVPAETTIVKAGLIHCSLGFPFSLVHTYLTGAFQYPLPGIWWSPFRDTGFVGSYVLGGWIAYVSFVAVIQVLKFNSRLADSQVELERVERRLVESNLNALRLQLEPHFLFNALNAISSEVGDNPKLVRRMIEDLGALLRRSLECHGHSEISLGEEFALLDHYLSIQRHRFGDRIKINIEVEPDTLTAMVPSMLLQPMIENAIRHGLERRRSGGVVAVTARRAGNEITIKVLDDGVGLPPRWRMESNTGLGVRVTRERLEALYGGARDHSFELSRRKGGGTQVTIRIPFHEAGVGIRASDF